MDDVKEYRRLPYRRVAKKIEAEGATEFVAFIEEIPWIRVHADEREEALLLLGEVFDEAVQAMLDAGDDVPVPSGTIERYGAPADTEPPARRWSVRAPEPVTFQEQDEPKPWDPIEVDPERKLEAIG